MTLKPDNRALRALLWFVIVFVPGGFLLLALFAADAVQRKVREQVAAVPQPDLTNVSLSLVSGPLMSGGPPGISTSVQS